MSTSKHISTSNGGTTGENGGKPIKRSKSTISINAMGLGLDFDHQSDLDPVEAGVRVSKIPSLDFNTSCFYDDVTTIYGAFQRGLNESDDGPCLGWKADSSSPYQWMSYSQVDKRATAFGSGLMALGLKPQNGTRVGVYSQNRPEYIIADQAFSRHSLTGVPLYDTLGVDAGTFIINQAEVCLVVCDNNDKVKKLLVRHEETPTLKAIVVCDPISDESRSSAKEKEVQILQFSEVEELGAKNPVPFTPATPEDNYIICYTSGTTGTPKGAMISHKNIISNMGGCLTVWEKTGFYMGREDIHISYLPLAHAYERMILAIVLTTGACMGFFQGDVKKLVDDVQELRPTFFPSVPRLLNRIHDKVMSGVNASKIKKILFNMAIKSKKKELEKGTIRNTSLWDKLVFSKVQASLGGRVRMITTGSAPLSAEVLTLLRCMMGCPIMEGYGQTECTAVATHTLIGDYESGHVGAPLPGVKVKLVDVPEMNYYAKDQKGEICIKSPGVIKGYLKNEEKTREAIGEDGWLFSGDIGMWLPNGALKIIDRKKHIFKLAQGEYIAPEKIENILTQSPYLAQVYVHGNSLEAFLVAVVVPDPETIPELASKLGVTGTLDEIANSPVVKKAILADITQVAKKNGLSSLEQVREIHVHPELFSVENGLLTPTFKSKRNEMASHFASVIADMYAAAKAATTSRL